MGHSPTPWELYEGRILSDGVTVADLVPRDRVKVPLVEREANGRLFLGAPALLAAAKDLIKRAQPYSKSALDSGYRYEVCQSAVKKLEDAIAKAAK